MHRREQTLSPQDAALVAGVSSFIAHTAFSPLEVYARKKFDLPKSKFDWNPELKSRGIIARNFKFARIFRMVFIGTVHFSVFETAKLLFSYKPHRDFPQWAASNFVAGGIAGSFSTVLMSLPFVKFSNYTTSYNYHFGEIDAVILKNITFAASYFGMYYTAKYLLPREYQNNFTANLALALCTTFSTFLINWPVDSVLLERSNYKSVIIPDIATSVEKLRKRGFSAFFSSPFKLNVPSIMCHAFMLASFDYLKRVRLSWDNGINFLSI